jgi:hypothetical protein
MHFSVTAELKTRGMGVSAMIAFRITTSAGDAIPIVTQDKFQTAERQSIQNLP